MTLSICGVVVALAVSVCGIAGAQSGVLDVRAFGAKGDGVVKDTAAFEAAISAAQRAGGGEVVVPAGRYVCSTIHLRSDLTIRLLSGATIAFSPDHAEFDPYEKLDYPTHADNETSYSHHALLVGDGVHNVAILGPGRIDGNRPKRGGPKPIALKDSSQIAIRDVTIENAPNYCISLLGCDYVVVDGVHIRNAYADGIDPDCCRFVRISNCFVDSADDAICLKCSPAIGKPRPTEHVTVTNCVLSSGSNNFKMGTESSGGFRDVAVSNCAMCGRPGDPGNSGIAIETVDGAALDGVVVSNITMQGVKNPIFIRLGNRGRAQETPTPGTLADVSISNIVAAGASATSSITGIPGHPVRRVSLSDVTISVEGGEKHAGLLDVPEQAKEYPDCDMFGTLPAFGFYCRHVEGLTMRNVRMRWRTDDARPAVTCDDVRDLDVAGLKCEALAKEQAAVWLHNVVGAKVEVEGAGPAGRLLKLGGTCRSVKRR